MAQPNSLVFVTGDFNPTTRLDSAQQPQANGQF